MELWVWFHDDAPVQVADGHFKCPVDRIQPGCRSIKCQKSTTTSNCGPECESDRHLLSCQHVPTVLNKYLHKSLQSGLPYHSGLQSFMS